MFTKNSILSKDQKNYGTRVVNENQKDATQKMLDDLKSQLKTAMVDLEWTKKIKEQLDQKQSSIIEIMENAAQNDDCFKRYFFDDKLGIDLLQQYYYALQTSSYLLRSEELRTKMHSIVTKFKNTIIEIDPKLEEKVKGLVKGIAILSEEQPKQAKQTTQPRYY